MFKKLSLFLSFLSLLLSVQVLGQRPEIGINIGAASYTGELNPKQIFKPSGLNAGFFGRINLDPYWSLGMNFNYAQVSANNELGIASHLAIPIQDFKSNLYELSAIAQFNFFDMYSPGTKKNWTPFIYSGIGGVIFRPHINGDQRIKDVKVIWDELKYDTKYKEYGLVLPIGFGVKIKQSESLTWQASLGYRYTSSDNLDVLSNQRDFSGDVLSNSLRKRDAYLFVNIGISYTFVSPKCFTF